MDQLSIKYTNIFHCKTLQNLPKFGFLVWRQTIWQPCFATEQNSAWTLTVLLFCFLSRQYLFQPANFRKKLHCFISYFVNFYKIVFVSFPTEVNTVTRNIAYMYVCN
jgi:hypothetical protein